MRRLVLLLLAAGAFGCVDYPEEQYICRSDSECGEGYTCARGPGCYCVCFQGNATGEIGLANPACKDPECLQPDGAQ